MYYVWIIDIYSGIDLFALSTQIGSVFRPFFIAFNKIDAISSSTKALNVKHTVLWPGQTVTVVLVHLSTVQMSDVTANCQAVGNAKLWLVNSSKTEKVESCTKYLNGL